MARIETVDQLRSAYPQPSDMVRKKQPSALEKHCKKIVSLSPMVLVGTSDTHGGQDVTPRGGEPGFVQVIDDRTLALPDWPENRIERDALPSIGQMIKDQLSLDGPVQSRAEMTERYAKVLY